MPPYDLSGAATGQHRVLDNPVCSTWPAIISEKTRFYPFPVFFLQEQVSPGFPDNLFRETFKDFSAIFIEVGYCPVPVEGEDDRGCKGKISFPELR